MWDHNKERLRRTFLNKINDVLKKGEVPLQCIITENNLNTGLKRRRIERSGASTFLSTFNGKQA